MSRDSVFGRYYRLSKPGIIYGNALTAAGGYFYGAALSPRISVFFAMLIGVCLVMASACVVNNIVDRDIDAMMERTKRRALVSGTISPLKALLFAAVLFILGVLSLGILTTTTTLIVALFGFFAYTVLYTYSKRFTTQSTLIGTLSGSTPPVIGYTAATGTLDSTALLLFLILVAWQMPHFYSIAIFRKDDYAAAHIPVLSVVKGVESTRKRIIWYVLLYIIACVLLGVYAGASLLLVVITVLAGAYWLVLCLLRPVGGDYSTWARRQFRWSLWLLLIMSIGWSLNTFIGVEI